MSEKLLDHTSFWERVTNPEDRHPLFDQIEKLLKNRTAVAGWIIITVFALAAVLASLISPHDPNENALYEQLKPPIWAPGGATKNILGTDDLGRDMLSRLIYGARVSLTLGLVSVGIAFFCGSFLGALAGFYKGWPDNLIMRFMTSSSLSPTSFSPSSSSPIWDRG